MDRATVPLARGEARLSHTEATRVPECPIKPRTKSSTSAVGRSTRSSGYSGRLKTKACSLLPDPGSISLSDRWTSLPFQGVQGLAHPPTLVRSNRIRTGAVGQHGGGAMLRGRTSLGNGTAFPLWRLHSGPQSSSVDQYSETPPKHLESSVADAMRRSVVTHHRCRIKNLSFNDESNLAGQVAG
jgi:hypothetical protein